MGSRISIVHVEFALNILLRRQSLTGDFDLDEPGVGARKMEPLEKLGGLPGGNERFVHLVMRPDGDEITVLVEDSPLANPESTDVVGDNDIHEQIRGIVGIRHDGVYKPTPDLTDKPRLRRADNRDAAVAISNGDMGEFFTLSARPEGCFLIQTFLRPDAL